MRSIIILVLAACAGAAKLNKSYLPPNHAQSSGGSDFLQTPVTYNGKTQDFNTNTIARIGSQYPSIGGSQVDYNSYLGRPRTLEGTAAILRQANENDGEVYSYAYETENGITAEENGVATNGVEAQGGYSYTGDDGQVYSIRYTAGQNGFVPVGDHLPTPPPVPEEILMALEQNARDEANGIFDDGSYKEYASAGKGFQSPSLVNTLSDNDSVVVNSAINQASRSEQRNQEVINTYLPPSVGSRSSVQNQRFGNVNRPAFNSRNGYSY